jgi:hypothetical protein
MDIREKNDKQSAHATLRDAIKYLTYRYHSEDADAGVAKAILHGLLRSIENDFFEASFGWRPSE